MSRSAPHGSTVDVEIDLNGAESSPNLGYEIFVIPRENDTTIVIYKENESTYEGKTEGKGKRNGFGKIRWFEHKGRSVSGVWIDDAPKPNSNFLIQYGPQKSYFGTVAKIVTSAPVMYFRQFVRQGGGILKDGPVNYIGQFLSNHKNGCGILTHRVSQLMFYGQFKKDLYHGKGCLKNLKDGTIYLGHFRENSFSGDGIIFFPQHKMCVSGYFVQNGNVRGAKINRVKRFDELLKWELIFSDPIFQLLSSSSGQQQQASSPGKKRKKGKKSASPPASEATGGGQVQEVSFRDVKCLNFFKEYFDLTFGDHVTFFSQAVVDVCSFVQFFLDFLRGHGVEKTAQEVVFNVLDCVGKSFFTLYRNKFRQKDERFSTRRKLVFDIEQFEEKFHSAHGLKKKIDFARSRQMLEQLGTTYHVLEKIKVLETFRETVVLEIESNFRSQGLSNFKVNVDILTEVFIMLFYRSRIDSHYANYNYVKDWISSDMNVERYSSRKIMSVIHFYDGFISFIEKVYDLYYNCTLIRKHIRGNILTGLLKTEEEKEESRKESAVKEEEKKDEEEEMEGEEMEKRIWKKSKKRKKKRKKKKKKKKRKKKSGEESNSLISEGFNTLKDLIRTKLDEDEDEDEESEEEQEQEQESEVRTSFLERGGFDTLKKMIQGEIDGNGNEDDDDDDEEEEEKEEEEEEEESSSGVEKGKEEEIDVVAKEGEEIEEEKKGVE